MHRLDLSTDWLRLLSDARGAGWVVLSEDEPWSDPTKARLTLEDPHGPFPSIRLYWRRRAGNWEFLSGHLYTPGLHPEHPNHVALSSVGQVTAVVNGYTRKTIPSPESVGPYLGLMEKLILSDDVPST